MAPMFEYLCRVSPNAKTEAMHKVDKLYTLFFDGHQLHISQIEIESWFSFIMSIFVSNVSNA